MNPDDLAMEMAAARKRREEKTAKQLQEARVYAIRSGLRPGSTREEIEERARSFYPRLREDLLNEAISQVYGRPKSQRVDSIDLDLVEPLAIVAPLDLIDPLDLADLVDPHAVTESMAHPDPIELIEPISVPPEP